MGAVQAQEYLPAKWGLALRSRGSPTSGSIDRALDQGRILRTHVLRPTWHFVTPADIRWMLELTGPRVHRIMARYDSRMGLDAAVMTRATAVLEGALGDRGCLSRRELATEVERAGLPATSRHLAHIVMYAELEGVVCSGPRRGKQFTYALVSERAPAAPRLSRDEALAELTRRYFRSHGPATIRDFVWWSGLTVADARRGLEMIGAKGHDVDGFRYWTVGRVTPIVVSRKTTVHLLPIYDEYLVAYRDHHAVPRPAYPFGGSPHALVIGGHLAGSWRAMPGAKEVIVDVRAERRLTAVERRALARAAQCFGEFLGVSANIRIQ
jgi:Winged helix DNA-binding domain